MAASMMPSLVAPWALKAATRVPSSRRNAVIARGKHRFFHTKVHTLLSLRQRSKLLPRRSLSGSVQRSKAVTDGTSPKWTIFRSACQDGMTVE
jgi:hypothetical protein